MPIIDEEGRLFGTINVVDALAVLLVIAVALAGIALVAGDIGGEMETRHVTLDFGPQPEYVIEQLDVGDAAALENGPDNLSITDTYFTPNGSRIQVLARVAVTGRSTEGTFAYGGEPLRLGRTIAFETDRYVANGTIRNVGNRTEIPTRTRTVILRGTVPNDVARTVEAGTEIQVANTTVASITEIATYDSNSTDRRELYLTVELETHETGDAPRFAGTRIESGQGLTLPVSGYQFSGTIERVGGTFDQSSADVLVTDVVDGSVAQRITEGDEYRVGNESVATVQNVATYGTDDPDRKRVYVGLSVQVLGFGEQPRFGSNRPLREGVTLPFRTNTYELTGEIVRLGTLIQPGESTERTVELKLENIPPERANSIEAGMSETNAGETVAQVTDVDVQSAVITLQSEDGNIYEREHPVNKTVTVTAELSVREHDTGVRFKGRTIQEGNTVVLDLGTTTIRAEVVDLSAE